MIHKWQTETQQPMFTDAKQRAGCWTGYRFQIELYPHLSIQRLSLTGAPRYNGHFDDRARVGVLGTNARRHLRQLSCCCPHSGLKSTRTLLKLVQPQVDDLENKGMEQTKWCVKEVARIPPMTRTRNAWCMFARNVSQQSPNLSCKNLGTEKQSVVNACCTQ